ncbi:tail fiber domain-containing protein [Halobacteriovorax sp. DA5]|uniref:tail fiber domain-containing protein n=1 Tax=Halobacteriovorax sp. DA5 TaxID=2067553 RepID=UPI000CD2D392|nr:tail fiber domain-containing protein [Halobacteriovorax sp. DA5]POB12989.1 hypothetical protein C0Z22_12860 [Halobacteriovorax sp. DA5]
MKKKNNSNQFGFTLAEVMVAAGLIGVLSLAVVNMMSNINRTSKRASQVFNVQQETQRITGILSNGDACKNTLQGIDIGNAPNYSTTQDVPAIKDANDDNIYTIGKELGAGPDTVNVNSMQVRRYFDPKTGTYGSLQNYTVGAVPFTKLEAQLLITFRKGTVGTSDDVIKKSSVGSIDITKRISMMVVVNAAGQIQSCYSTADEFLDSACRNLGGTIDGVDGGCKDVKLTTLKTTPDTSITNAVTIGSSDSAAIGDAGAANAPLRVKLGSASRYLSVDDSSIQTNGGPLELNPFGRVQVGGGAGSSEISNGTTAPANAPLKVMGAGSTFMAFDENEIQVSNGTSTGSLHLNPYGPSVTIGKSQEVAHLNLYGNLNIGDPSSTITTTRVINLYDGSYINFLSDESVKDDVAVLDGVLDKLERVKGVSFVWKDTGRKDIGYIAQDLEKVFPEVVERDPETGLLNVQYTKMPAVNTAAIKELKRENDELKFRVNLLMNALCNGEDAHKYEEVCSIPIAPLE